jgi:hypothetical protein
MEINISKNTKLRKEYWGRRREINEKIMDAIFRDMIKEWKEGREEN